MGHKATIGRSLRPAPRVRVTERVTGYAQTVKAERLAGEVTTVATGLQITTEQPIPQAVSPIALQVQREVEPYAGENMTRGDVWRALNKSKTAWSLWLREGKIELRKRTVNKMSIWFATYAGQTAPMMLDNGKPMNLAAAQAHIVNLLVVG